MELTVLGRNAPYPAAGGAMNGYLVRCGRTSLLLDAGNGVASRLLQQMAVEDLTAIVVSHLHEDHIADIQALRYAQSAARTLGLTTAKLQVYIPIGSPAQQRLWLEGGEEWQELHEYDPEKPLVLGELEVRFTRTEHPIPCYAMRVQPVEGEGPVLFYTADTAVSEKVVEAAQGADLFLVEATLTEEYESMRSMGHLTAVEAAAMARDAGVKRCLFTHIWPAVDPQQLLTEGRPVFAQIELAQEGRTYRV